ncbi:amidohydrolase [Sphingomonas sp.]|uniref:amidohydrolase n=1 Tax=Sphingomonas sp. TaxID=28214 RepID=UPI003CC63276
MFRTAVAVFAAFSLAGPALADGLIDNVNGVTLDREGHVLRFTGLLLADGKVRALLAREAARPARPDWRLDMHGRVMLPGMIDAHGHVMELGFRAMALDLSDATSLADAQAMIRAYAAANPDKRWILGGGWNQERWHLGRFPTAAELDAAVGDRPVWLARADGHASWANTAAMRAGGVTARAVAPPGGRIERAGGAPSGVFVDAAKVLIQHAVPPPLPKERDAAFLTAQAILHRSGITAVADMGTSIDDWLSFRRMGDAGALRVRIMSYAVDQEVASAVGGRGPTPWLYADRLRMGGVGEIYEDGALGSRGAWLKAPYADAPGQTGAAQMTEDQLQNRMSRAAMDGWQVAVHAIGDRANAAVLDAIDVLAPTYGGDRRWRIEHAQIVDPADLSRFGQHGVIASMQPTHQTSDRTMAEARLGTSGIQGARLTGAYAWASMLRVGAKLAFGSDFPVERPDPWAGWAAAFTRADPDGQPFGGWRSEERVSREQAWWAFTGGAAYAGFAEDKFGILAVGQRADFIIVDRDPLLASPTELRATQVLETWVGGERMWERTP